MGGEIAEEFFGRPRTDWALGCCFAFHGSDEHFKAMIAIFAVKFVNRHDHSFRKSQNMESQGEKHILPRQLYKLICSILNYSFYFYGSKSLYYRFILHYIQ